MKLIIIILLVIASSTSKVFAIYMVNVTCNFDDGSPGICRENKYCAKLTKPCFTSMDIDYYCCERSSFIRARTAERYCDHAYRHHYPIANGLPTEPAEFPYMAALGWPTSQQNVFDYKCGGALISENFVVTAAHCAYVNGRQPVVILAGGVNLTDRDTEIFPITNIIVHPEYRSNMSYHDIALVQFPFDKFYPTDRVACLWVKEEIFHKTFTAVGYGHTKFAKFQSGSNQLLKASLDLVDHKECQDYYEDDNAVPNGILNKQLCAKDPAELRDTCQGDSGGPIIMYKYEDDANRPYLVGITSFGQGCAHEPPGVYTRISSYIDWIEGIMWPTVPEA